MAIRSEAPDLAVDELKRRARRRLVGAVVLALAAAVILPLLLESDPKPLGDEVSVRIPPVDNSKFVNPLSPDAATPAAPPTAPADAKSPPKKSIAEAERRALGQPPLTPKTDAAVPADATKADAGTTKTNEPAPSSPARVSQSSPAKTDTPAVTEQAPKTDTPTKADTPAKADTSAKVEAPAKSTASPPKSVPPPTKSDGVASAGAFAIQVGAFADTKVAADLAAQLKAGGYGAYVEAVPTTHGTVRRVRVGPFTTRGDADATLSKLKAGGYDRALVIPAK
jgi:DedD protein